MRTQKQYEKANLGARILKIISGQHNIENNIEENNILANFKTALDSFYDNNPNFPLLQITKGNVTSDYTLNDFYDSYVDVTGVNYDSDVAGRFTPLKVDFQEKLEIFFSTK